MECNVLATGMGYIVTMTSHGSEVARFEVEDVERMPWGVQATITVRTPIAGAQTLGNNFLTQERVSLLSSKSRTELGNRLQSLVPSPSGGGAIDWVRVVEEVCLSVLESEKRPLEVFDLSVVEPAKEIEFLVPGIIPVRMPTILYGIGGTGKSIYAMALAAAVQTGTPIMGWNVRQANVLYLDWETDEEDAARRIALASAGLGLTSPAPIRYVFLSDPLSRQQSTIAALCAEENIGMVVIDSVAMATMGGSDGGDVGANAVKFFRALRALNAASLLIDHVSSEDMKKKDGTPKPMGSVIKFNSARWAFELLNATGQDEDVHRVTLRHRKHNLGPRIADLTWVYEWEDDSVRLRKVTYAVRFRPLPDRIEEALSTGPSSARGLTILLNEEPGYDRVNEFEVRAAALAMLRADKIVMSDTGNFRLKEAEKDPNLGLEDQDDDEEGD